jgi:hypothetical protein
LGSDCYRAHQAVAECFGAGALWRAGERSVLVLAGERAQGDLGRLGVVRDTCHDLAPVWSAIEPGAVLRVDVRLNPVRRFEGKVSGTLVEPELDPWFERLGGQHGFSLVHTTWSRPVTHRGRRRGVVATIVTRDLDAQVTVDDPIAFRSCLAGGLGRAKWAGAGLVLLRR